MDDISFGISYSSPEASHSWIALGGTIKIELVKFLRRRIPVNWTSSPHDGFAQGGRDYRRIKVKGFQDVLLILRGGEVGAHPTFGVNYFLKILIDRVPQNLRGGDGILEDSIVALFPSVPENKAWGKHLELVEDVTFKGANFSETQ